MVSDDGSRTLRKTGSRVTWHSESGALPESQTVFIQNGGVAKFWTDQPGRTLRILEVGFGTGLNFWLTASIALRDGRALDYRSSELNLLPFEIISQLGHADLPECQPAFDLFHHSIFGSTDRGKLPAVVKDRNVNLQIDEDCETAIMETEPGSLDLVYHDPFSPADAPELWTVELFQELHSRLRPGGRLLTYCVKSSVQKTLRLAGFQIKKTKGPIGGKREVLIAIKPEFEERK